VVSFLYLHHAQPPPRSALIMWVKTSSSVRPPPNHAGHATVPPHAHPLRGDHERACHTAPRLGLAGPSQAAKALGRSRPITVQGFSFSFLFKILGNQLKIQKCLENGLQLSKMWSKFLMNPQE
jgi:hypothetical protein